MHPTNGTLKNSIKLWLTLFRAWWPDVEQLFISICPECGRLKNILWWDTADHRARWP